jgi:hypothetical protein
MLVVARGLEGRQQRVKNRLGLYSGLCARPQFNKARVSTSIQGINPVFDTGDVIQVTPVVTCVISVANTGPFLT